MITTPTPSTPNSVSNVHTPMSVTPKISNDDSANSSGYTFQFEGAKTSTTTITPETSISYNNNPMAVPAGSIVNTPGSTPSILKQNQQYPAPPIHQQPYQQQQYYHHQQQQHHHQHQHQRHQQQMQSKPFSKPQFQQNNNTRNNNGPRTFKQQGGIHKSAKSMGFPKLKQQGGKHSFNSKSANNSNIPPINNTSPIKTALNNFNNITAPAAAHVTLRSTPEERALELIKWLKREKNLPRRKQLERKPLLIQWKRYFTNGYVFGKIIEAHHIQAGLKCVKALKILDDGSSTDIKLDNWDIIKKYCKRRQVKFPIKEKEIKDIQEMKSIDTVIIVMTRLYYYLYTLRAIALPKLDVNIIGQNLLPTLIAAMDAKNNTHTNNSLPQWRLQQQQREQQLHLTGGIGDEGHAILHQQQQQQQQQQYGSYGNGGYQNHKTFSYS